MITPTHDRSEEPAPRPVAIRFEQAVYGSFAFRPDGYAMLASSPGCREEWLADFRNACRRMGERPAGAPDRSSLFATRLASGPWCVVGVFPQGADDKGRPGALAFHGIFLGGRDYRALGASPFPLQDHLRGDWSETTSLESGDSSSLPETTVVVSHQDLAGRIAKVLRRGRKALIESPEPATELAREVWRRLPASRRRRLSVGTWAFSNANGFDLFISPKLAGVELESTSILIDPTAPTPEELALGSRFSFRPTRWIAFGVLGTIVILTISAVGYSLQLRDEMVEPTGATSPRPAAPSNTVASRVEPGPVVAGLVVVNAEEREQLTEALVHALERFDVHGSELATEEAGRDPGVLMDRLAAGLRYTGPFLSEDERRSLQGEPGRDAELVLQWDEHVRKFALDRPLPTDFQSRDLGSQISLLAWTFHFNVDRGDAGRLSAAEMVQALAENLALNVALRQTPMVERYPALISYLSFLGRLPRR